MEKAIYDRLTDAGIDVDGALSRVMGNEGLFLRILAKLKKDENFQGLKKAFLEGDREAAFGCAHTLKGICGNVSADRLFELFSEQVRLMRADRWSEAEELMSEIDPLYERLLSALPEQL